MLCGAGFLTKVPPETTLVVRIINSGRGIRIVIAVDLERKLGHLGADGSIAKLRGVNNFRSVWVMTGRRSCRDMVSKPGVKANGRDKISAIDLLLHATSFLRLENLLILSLHCITFNRLHQ